MPDNNSYGQLVEIIIHTLQQARQKAAKAVHVELVMANWLIGKHIVEYEQQGNERADYGSRLITNLSRDLKGRFGRGFSRSNLQLMRLFYIKYPSFQKSQTVSGKFKKPGLLSWSHYAELLTVSDDFARSFYEKQSVSDGWSVREMKRQIDTALFQRIALSKNKDEILALAKSGSEVAKPPDIIRDPYIFEFLQIPTESFVQEKDLEKKLIDKLQQFLLELGKGFSFVARQFAINIDNQHFFVDLVFYHRILRCFVLIDLKSGKVKHQDIGQMNMYLNYFAEEENIEGDNKPVGIIVAADKNELLVKYATGGLSNQIFVSKYQFYLPDKKLLEEKIKELLGK